MFQRILSQIVSVSSDSSKVYEFLFCETNSRKQIKVSFLSLFLKERIECAKKFSDSFFTL